MLSVFGKEPLTELYFYENKSCLDMNSIKLRTWRLKDEWFYASVLMIWGLMVFGMSV